VSRGRVYTLRHLPETSNLGSDQRDEYQAAFARWRDAKLSFISKPAIRNEVSPAISEALERRRRCQRQCVGARQCCIGLFLIGKES
jgi:hypothetical protein